MRRARTQGPPRHLGRSLKGKPAPDGIETFFEVRTRDSELPPEEFARLPRRPVHIVHHKLEQTSLGTTDSVPWRRFDDVTSALADLRAKGIQIVGVETARGASPYHRFEYNFPVALVLGNEALGVSEAALRMCDAVVEIPVFGYKNSINVATAAAVVLYGMLRQGNWLDEIAATRPDGISESGT